MTDRALILAQVCSELEAGHPERASKVLSEMYPFERIEKTQRRYTERDLTTLFVRDGFVDRYRGTRLVFPPTLRLISDSIPDHFPYHPNWKMDACHVGYWELTPTLDHVLPVSRGGEDDNSNRVTCSMLTNGIKANWTLEQLGWEVLPPGDFEEWDGLLNWFVRQVQDCRVWLNEHEYHRRWYNAAKPFAI